jgi:peptide alpha-N-acetyltransferase
MLKSSSELPPKVAELLSSEFKVFDASADLKKVNEEYLAKHKSSPRHVLSVVKARRTLGADLAQCEKDLTGVLSLPDVSFEDAIAVSETLQSWRSGQLGSFKQTANGKWPEVTRLR